MRIIIVDDERLHVVGLKKDVRKVAPKAEVKGFTSPKEALEYAQEKVVDVAFLDMEMPGLHGLFLAQRLQKVNPRVNIVFVSATKDHMKIAWEIHASGFVLKPASRERLAQEILHLRYAAETQLTPA